MRPNAAAAISVVLVAIVIVAPTALLGQMLIAELIDTLHALRTDLNSENLRVNLQHYPAIVNFWEWIQTKLDIEKQLQAAAGAVAGTASAWVSVSFWFLTQLILTFLTLYYFLRDQAGMLQFFSRFIPLSREEIEDILGRIAQTVNSSLYKNLLVKLIQGFLGGLMFWWLGLRGSYLVWGRDGAFRDIACHGHRGRLGAGRDFPGAHRKLDQSLDPDDLGRPCCRTH